MKNQRDLIRAAHIEMIPDHSFKPHPTCLRPVEHAGVGNLELPERHLITVSSPEIGLSKRRRQSPQPPPEEALHRAGTEAITDLLQCGGILAAPESITQGFITDAGFLQLSFGPLVAIQPDPDRIGRIRVGLPERPAPLRIPEIEIEVIDIGHLPSPIHVRVAGLLLPFPRPRFPNRCFLLGYADQHYAILTLTRCCLQIGKSCFLFLLAFFEVHDRNVLSFGKTVNGLHIRIPDFAERG